MDEYCGYEVDDVYSGEVLDEVMCEVCGTIQPVENKICSYCGAKIQSKEAKKARKKKRKKESGDYVPARKKINRKPPSKPAAENTMEKPKPMEKPTPMERPKPIERPTPIVKPKPVDIPKPIEKPKPVDIPKPIEKPKPVEFPKPAESPKPVDSFLQKLAEIHNSVEFPESVVEKPMAMPEDVEFPESVVEKPMAMPEEVEFPESIVEKPMEMPEDVEFPESIVEKPMEMPEDVEFPQSVVEKPMAMPEEVEFPQSVVEMPMAMPEEVEFPQSVVEMPMAMPEDVEFPQSVVEKLKSVEFPKPVERPKPTDSFAQRLAEIHNSVKLPEDVADEADEADFEMPDVQDRTSRHSVSINKLDLQKPEPIINPPRPATSISRLRSQSAESDTSAYADNENFTDNSDLENTAAKKFWIIIAVMALVLVIFFSVVRAFETKEKQRQKENPSNYSAPVTYYDDGRVSFDYTDGELLVVGDDIPEGEYFLYSSESGEGRMAVGNIEQGDAVCYSDISDSLYLTLKEGEVILLKECELYLLEEPFGLNNPYENSGMFKVGFDIEAGAYEFVPCGNGEQPCVRVHKESVYDMYSFFRNPVSVNETIVVEDGDYLELRNCVLK